MVDFEKPLRIAGSKRQVFITGNTRWGPRLDTMDTGRDTGFVYDRTGEAVDEGCPWGLIENFDPGEGLFLTEEEVMSPVLKRAAEKIEADNNANPLWGAF